MASIGFLHTSPVHEATFDALVAEIAPGTEVVTVVDEYLLDRARSHGTDDLQLLGGIADRLAQLVGVDLVVCTCSTIGGVAERIGEAAGVAVVRVDRPMAEVAVTSGERITVVATVESTLGPSVALLAEAATLHGRTPSVETRLIAGAWERFESGDLEGYVDLVAGALPEIAADADVVVLAQASMMPAVDRLGGRIDGTPVLASPRTAVAALLG